MWSLLLQMLYTTAGSTRNITWSIRRMELYMLRSSGRRYEEWNLDINLELEWRTLLTLWIKVHTVLYSSGLGIISFNLLLITIYKFHYSLVRKQKEVLYKLKDSFCLKFHYIVHANESIEIYQFHKNRCWRHWSCKFIVFTLYSNISAFIFLQRIMFSIICTNGDFLIVIYVHLFNFNLTTVQYRNHLCHSTFQVFWFCNKKPTSFSYGGWLNFDKVMKYMSTSTNLKLVRNTVVMQKNQDTN